MCDKTCKCLFKECKRTITVKAKGDDGHYSHQNKMSERTTESGVRDSFYGP